MTSSSRYLVQVREPGEPWDTVHQAVTRGQAEGVAAALADEYSAVVDEGGVVRLPIHAHVRVQWQHHTIYERRGAAA